MSTYEPGTVAVATVNGVTDVRVVACYGGPAEPRLRWFTNDERAKGPAGDGWHMHGVTDIRPLVVLDIAGLRGQMVAAPTAEEVPSWLRNLADSNTHGPHVLGSQAARLIADQIEAQTKPPRIPEPGLWAVVEAGHALVPTRRWVHHEEDRWIADEGTVTYWPDLINPSLIRDGVEKGAS